jgi:hypothetical protein
MTRSQLSAALADILPDALEQHLPAKLRPTRFEPDWKFGLAIAGVAFGACLAAAGALAWISRETRTSVDKVAFNYPYDDEESWFV